jgi:hypothetical protein
LSLPSSELRPPHDLKLVSFQPPPPQKASYKHLLPSFTCVDGRTEEEEEEEGIKRKKN